MITRALQFGSLDTTRTRWSSGWSRFVPLTADVLLILISAAPWAVNLTVGFFIFPTEVLQKDLAGTWAEIGPRPIPGLPSLFSAAGSRRPSFSRERSRPSPLHQGACSALVGARCEPHPVCSPRATYCRASARAYSPFDWDGWSRVSMTPAASGITRSANFSSPWPQPPPVENPHPTFRIPA